MYQMEIVGLDRTTCVADRLIQKRVDFRFISNPPISSCDHGGTFEVDEEEAGTLQQAITSAWDAFPDRS